MYWSRSFVREKLTYHVYPKKDSNLKKKFSAHHSHVNMIGSSLRQRLGFARAFIQRTFLLRERVSR